MFLGWGALAVIGLGVFWAVTSSGEPVRRNRVRRNRLSAKARKQIPLDDFVFPERRAWPLDTKKRAKAAIAYLHMGRVKSKSEYLAIRNAIIRRYGMAFWRDANGPSWPKIAKAKSKRSRDRRRRAA